MTQIYLINNQALPDSSHCRLQSKNNAFTTDDSHTGNILGNPNPLKNPSNSNIHIVRMFSLLLLGYET